MDEILLWIGQGLVLTALVTLTLGRARRVSASMRYRLWWTTMALVLALPLLATLELPGLGALLGFSVFVDAAPMATAATASHQPAAWSWANLLIVLGAAAWTIVSAARMHVAFAHLDAAKRGCKPFPFVRERQLARWKSARNRGRRATLVLSDHVRAAGVLGLGYPRIAVNADLLSRLGDEELDQLVLHEYAHVQRRDDIAAVAQSIVRALVGWHPAVWWIDRRLRVEREVACDDWVVGTTDAPRTYARVLTRIADVSAGNESMLVPASGRRSHLSMRVMRLLDGERNTSTRISGVALATAALLLTVVSIGLVGRQVLIVPQVVIAEDRARPSSPAASTSSADATVTMASREPQRAAGARRVADAARTALQTAVGTAEAATLPARRIDAAFNDAGRLDVAAAVRDTRAASATPTQAAIVADAGRSSTPPPVASPDESSASNAPVSPTSNDAPVAEDDSAWIATSGRAVATAGVVASRSIADAGVTAGGAVADAGTAAYRGSRNAAVKTARFFSRLGKRLF